MPIDYSKWDNLTCSDTDDEIHPKVIRLDKDQKIRLDESGYNILENKAKDRKINKYIIRDDDRNALKLKSHECLTDLEKEWTKRILNGGVNPRSHFFSQNRYDINCSIALYISGKLSIKVSIDETSVTVYNDDREVFSKNFYGKIKDQEDYWTWEISTREIDWDSLYFYSKQINEKSGAPKTLKFKDVEKVTLLDMDLKKKGEIANCFIWWPKLFKEDAEENKTVNENTEFAKVWDEAHAVFRERAKDYEKIPV